MTLRNKIQSSVFIYLFLLTLNSTEAFSLIQKQLLCAKLWMRPCGLHKEPTFTELTTLIHVNRNNSKSSSLLLFGQGSYPVSIVQHCYPEAALLCRTKQSHTGEVVNTVVTAGGVLPCHPSTLNKPRQLLQGPLLATDDKQAEFLPSRAWPTSWDVDSVLNFSCLLMSEKRDFSY